ncbi:MAG: phage holin family protein [Chloroflexota bacterium]|nr:phage holin family protein [Chloroflexota bacterium]
MQREERSLAELFSELSSETSTLVRQEIQLAKVELTQKAKSISKDIAYIAAGGAVAYAGLIVLTFALVYLLAEIIWPWLAALIVGLVVVGVGYGLVQSGLSKLKQANLKPERTIETLKEDKEWAKHQVK